MIFREEETMGAFLKGNRIVLRTLRREDLKELASLMADREIGELTGEVYPLTEKEMDGFYEKCQKTDDRIWFLIIDAETDKIIGETGFLRIFTPWRTADYSLMIYDRAYWNKGFGKEAAALMLDYGFNALNFHRLAIGVVGFNGPALKFWKSIGFNEEGRQKDGYFCRGKYHDFIMMSLLESDYRKNIK
jgi:RimJ/RimL family protein N-acetyltransferase